MLAGSQVPFFKKAQGGSEMKLTHIILRMLTALAIICLTDNIAAAESNEAFLPEKDSQDLGTLTVSGEKRLIYNWVRTGAWFACTHGGSHDLCYAWCWAACCTSCYSNVEYDTLGYAKAYAAVCSDTSSPCIKKQIELWGCASKTCSGPGFAHAFAKADPEHLEGDEGNLRESQADLLQSVGHEGCGAWADTIFFTVELDTSKDSLSTALWGDFGTRRSDSLHNSYSFFSVSVFDSVANDTLYWGRATLIDTALSSQGARLIVEGDLDSSKFSTETQKGHVVMTRTRVDSIVAKRVYVHDESRLHIDCEHHAWVWHDSISPTFVELSSFTATGGDGYIGVEWETASEIDNAGFNIHRGLGKEGPSAQLNEGLIPAQGDELQGASYSLIDEDVTPGLTYYYWLEDVDLHGRSTMHGPVTATPTSVEEREETPIPTVFSLAQNYPNPFNAFTLIRYALPAVSSQQSAVGLKIYNIAGQEIRTLVEEEQAPGYYSVSWDGRDGLGKEVSSGIYFYRLQAGSYTEIKKMILLK